MCSSLVESLLGDLFSNHISVRLMRHAATLDLAQFEDPEFYDHLERARRQTTGRIGLIALLLAMGQDLLTLLSLGAALVVHNPLLRNILDDIDRNICDPALAPPAVARRFNISESRARSTISGEAISHWSGSRSHSNARRAASLHLRPRSARA